MTSGVTSCQTDSLWRRDDKCNCNHHPAVSLLRSGLDCLTLAPSCGCTGRWEESHLTPPLPSLLTHFNFDTETARAAEQSRGRQRSGCGGTCTLQGVCMHEPDLTLDDLRWDVLSFYWRLQHPQNDEYPAEPCSCWELLCVERWQQLPIPGIGGETENAALFLCTSTWNPFNLSRLINRIRSEV